MRWLEFSLALSLLMPLANCSQQNIEESCSPSSFGRQKLATITSNKLDDWKPEEIKSLRRGAYYEVGSFHTPHATWLIFDVERMAVIKISRTVGPRSADHALRDSGTVVRHGATNGREWIDRVLQRSVSSKQQSELICNANSLWLDPRTRETNALAFGIMQSLWLVDEDIRKEFSGTGVISKPADVFKERLSQLTN